MKLKKFQMGGEMAPAPTPGTGEQAGPGPEEQLAQMAQQIIQELGPEAAAMLAQMIAQMLQGGGQAPPQEAPVMQRKGGRLVRVSRQ